MSFRSFLAWGNFFLQKRHQKSAPFLVIRGRYFLGYPDVGAMRYVRVKIGKTRSKFKSNPSQKFTKIFWGPARRQECSPPYLLIHVIQPSFSSIEWYQKVLINIFRFRENRIRQWRQWKPLFPLSLFLTIPRGANEALGAFSIPFDRGERRLQGVYKEARRQAFLSPYGPSKCLKNKKNYVQV